MIHLTPLRFGFLDQNFPELAEPAGVHVSKLFREIGLSLFEARGVIFVHRIISLEDRSLAIFRIQELSVWRVFLCDHHLFTVSSKILSYLRLIINNGPTGVYVPDLHNRFSYNVNPPFRFLPDAVRFPAKKTAGNFDVRHLATIKRSCDEIIAISLVRLPRVSGR